MGLTPNIVQILNLARNDAIRALVGPDRTGCVVATTKTRLRGTRPRPSFLPPLGRSQTKFPGRCAVPLHLCNVCVSNLIRIGWDLPELFPKD